MAVSLGKELGKGGEGTVYEVSNHPQLVAKIYHRPADRERAEKISEMVALRTERLLGAAAWPIETLHSQSNHQMIGLVMPRVSGFKAIHCLYGPKSRLAEFPNANWQFLIHAAGNLARAFATIHGHGHVVGDVNHGNVLVSNKATVMIIDCDSFQVSANGKHYFCEVGVPTHQPPELQMLGSFRGLVRTENHDNFGLAVLMFQLLMMGRHPFSGRYFGTGDMSIERAIKEFRFAYGSSANSLQMQPPPNTLDLKALTQDVASMFERAFSPGSCQGRARPTANEWTAAIEALSKRVWRCSRNPNHHFLVGLPSCPWCEIEGKSGIFLFGVVGNNANVPNTLDLDATWLQITSIGSPGPARKLPNRTSLHIQPTSSAKWCGRKRRARNALSIALGCISLAGLVYTVFVLPSSVCWGFLFFFIAAMVVKNLGQPGRDAARKELELAKSRWQSIISQWENEASDRAFLDKKRALEGARQGLLDLPKIRNDRLRKLEMQRRDRQLSRFLESHRLSTSRLEGIGPGREATLRSYGIETASDVTLTAIIAIPGFGPVLTESLLTWKRGLEKRFIFDPQQGIDSRDIHALDKELASIRAKHEEALRNGAAQLTAISKQTLQNRQVLWPNIEQALEVLARAEAEWKAF